MKTRRTVVVLGLAANLVFAIGHFGRSEEQKKPASTEGKPANTAAKPAGKPRKVRAPLVAGPAIGQNKATPVERIRAAKDFRVELLYSVPADKEGSWVNLCLDNRGRIMVSDQYGGLYRFTPPPAGQPLAPAAIEKVPAEVRAVNGMLWAFGALYVVVNDYERKMPNGLYRLTDADGDDKLEKVELIRLLDSAGDHGVHALLPTPDGKALYWVTGNGTKRADYTSTRVPACWGEDHLLPRIPDGRGFMRDVLGPGGIIYRISPDGKDCEIVSAGYRNIFDAAINHDGELFTYDADMEYDFNTSWYRPTRVCHATSGSEYGWRNGAGKRPEWYPDTLPPVLNIGPGSPTGMTFGYGAKFPAKYQEACFILDWSWGKLYAVHLHPTGSTYTATKEEFVSGTPLPLTDAIINPADGAMYFAIGGRRVQSGLYRVTYTGKESTAPIGPAPSAGEADRALRDRPPTNFGRPANHLGVGEAERGLRHRLEAFHGHQDPQAVAEAWPYLAHPDRFIRWAARTAIEFQPPATWADRALNEPNPTAKLEALLALTRVTAIDPQHFKPTDPPNNKVLQSLILSALVRLDWKDLSDEDRLKLVRIYEISFVRGGPADDALARRIVAQLDPHFPSPSFPLNWVLCETLVYLQAPSMAAKGIALLENAPSQEEQIEYARSLRMLKAGWTLPLRTSYFNWFFKAANYRGGASFDKFVEFIRNDALATLTDDEEASLADLLAKTPQRKSPMEGMAELFKGRTLHNWTLDELASAAQEGMKHRNFAQGRKMFGAALCYTCHRFVNEGGMTGPDLTGAGGRYSARDFLDQVINPSKVINEQFVPTVIVTEDDEVITGVIVNLKGDTIMVCTDPVDPFKQTAVDRKKIVSMEPSKNSPMPNSLLGMLTKDEILDLLAYVLSGANPKAEVFRK